MIQTIIRFILAKLAGITAQQWTKAVEWVVHVAATMRDSSGAEKKKRVLESLSTTWPELSKFAGNLLVEMALAFARENGQA